MDEAESWSRRARRRAVLAWERYTDLGFGAWVIGVVVVGAIALGISLLVGGHAHHDTSCTDATPAMTTIDRLDGHKALTAQQADRLHQASTRLTVLSEKAATSAVAHVLAGAAQVAASAQAGQPFDAGFSFGRFESACDFSAPGGINHP